MARCKHHDFLSRLVTPLPLLIANRTFKCLDSMQDMELAVFLRYLVRFTSKEEEWDPDIKPLWWGGDLTFPRWFCSANTEIPFAKDKLVKMRNVIVQCYIHYDQIELILLSERLADRGPYFFQSNPNDTVTVYRADKRLPLVVIPASNLDYETPLQNGALMNVGVKRRLRSAPVRRTLLKFVEVELPGSEVEDDCIAMDPSQFSDEEAPSSSNTQAVASNSSSERKSNVESISSEDDDSPVEPVERPRTPKMLRPVIDLTKDGDDDYVAQRVFMKSLGLASKNEKPPQPHSPGVWATDSDRKYGFPLKKLNLCDVPFFVRMGILPKACLATKEDIQLYAKFIDAV